jgi:hypothetical protein
MLYDIGQGFFADAQQVMLKDIPDFPGGAPHTKV